MPGIDSSQRLTPPPDTGNAIPLAPCQASFEMPHRHRDLLRQLMVGRSIRDQDRDLGPPVLWIWLVRRANKVVLDTPIPTRHFALLNHSPVDVVLLRPIHQCGRCLHERVIWSAMDHGSKGASWDLRGTHNSISRQGGCSDRDPHVNVDLAGTVVNDPVANQRCAGHMQAMLLNKPENRS